MRAPLWLHQRRAVVFAVDRLRRHGCTAIFAGMGTGKSRVAIMALGLDAGEFPCAEPNAGRTLIIAPLAAAQSTWPQQLDRWADDRQVLDLTSGPVVGRANKLLSAARKKDVVAITNYEAARTPNFQRAAIAFLSERGCHTGLILDESHRCASPQTATSKAMAILGRAATYRIAMTGTPFTTALGPLGAWSQMRAIGASAFEEKSWTRFCEHYLEWVPRKEGSDYVRAGRGGALMFFRYKDTRELEYRVNKFAFQVRTKDVLDLPPEIDRTLRITLPPKVRKTYTTLRRSLVADIGGLVMTAPMALTLALRLQQITGGFAKPDNHQPGVPGAAQPVFINPAKSHALAEILGDLPPDERIVVICRFRSELAQVRAIAAKEKRIAFELSGRIKQLAQFEQSPGSVLAMQIQAGAEGIDLTCARHVVWWSPGTDLTKYLQARARVHRPGQNLPVVHTHLVTADTVDETIYQALTQRESVADAIMARLAS